MDAKGHSTTYEFSDSGNVERATLPVGDSGSIGGGADQYTYACDARHNVTQVIDPRGNTTQHTYNLPPPGAEHHPAGGWPDQFHLRRPRQSDCDTATA